MKFIFKTARAKIPMIRRGTIATNNPANSHCNPIALKTVADVLQLLSTTATDVRMGNVDSKIGNCLTYISTAALKAITGADFEERLQALEKLAQQQQRRA